MRARSTLDRLKVLGVVPELKVLGAGLVWSRVVPELLGAGGSLLELDISHSDTRSLQGNCRGPNGQKRSDT